MQNLKNMFSQTRHLSRRSFLGSSAAVAAFSIVPSSVLAANGQSPPSEKLNIAGVGLRMGHNNLMALREEHNIVAICDVDESRLAEVASDFPAAKHFTDYRVMLDKMGKDIDGVVVATPDHTHAVVAMAAMQMGKHVYVQKPLTHSIHEARTLTEAARRYKVMTQMGNQGRGSETVRLICEWIWDGAIGPVREVHTWTNRCPRGWYNNMWSKRPSDTPPVPAGLHWDLWLGPAAERPYHPSYHPSSWRAWWDFGTGALGDMGCHVLDPVYWALKLKYPTAVQASFTHEVEEMFPFGTIMHFEFPAREDMPPVKMHWYDGGLLPERPEELEPGRMMGDRDGGVIFVGDKGKLMCGCYASNPRLIPETEMQQYKRPPKILPRVHTSHELDWANACKTGKPACSNFDVAGPFTEIVLLGNLAIGAGAGFKIDWDGENMKATNAPQLESLIKHEYRKGWSLG